LQQQKITGQVTDASTGEPLPGVSVSIEGTTLGVITDVSGNYIIEVPNQNVVLLFSYMGYLSERFTVSNQETIDIKLALDIKKLDEIVVVGYGTVKRSDLTGAVSQVKSEVFDREPLLILYKLYKVGYLAYLLLQFRDKQGLAIVLKFMEPSRLLHQILPYM
jgi:hypothetical protein